MRPDAASILSPPVPRQASLRRLIVNADDFGKSAGINTAILRAHREGILTTASLMVNEPACAEAVQMARDVPTLGVGLHLSLVCGRSSLVHRLPRGLVDDAGNFASNPVAAGCRYFFLRAWREPLRAEIRTQLERFQNTGLTLDHVNGHLHIHLHPVIFELLMEEMPRFGAKTLRLTNDPWRLNARLASGRWLYRASHWAIYQVLAARARPALRRAGIRHTEHVFGLLQNACVNEEYLCGLLRDLPPGDSELYSHPSLDEFRHEFEGLISPRVQESVRAAGVKLIRYQDL